MLNNVEDNDSMDITAVKGGETMNLEFQHSDKKIVTTSFSWEGRGARSYEGLKTLEV